MIEYINYQGNKLPVRLSYGVLKRIQKSENINLEDFNLEDLETLLFWGLESGCKAEKIEMPFKQEDMEDILDESFLEFRKMLPRFFAQLKDEVENDEKTESKKKK